MGEGQAKDITLIMSLACPYADRIFIAGGGCLLKNFFDKNEKLTERVFIHGVLTSVIGILLCMAALCSAAYAWFSADSSTAVSALKSGSFDVTVTAEKADGGETVTFSETSDGGFECVLDTAGEYTVTLKMTDGSNVKGFCAITAGGTEYCTAVIVGENSDGLPVSDPFMFTITSAEDDTTVVIMPKWGMPSAAETIPNGGAVTLT